MIWSTKPTCGHVKQNNEGLDYGSVVGLYAYHVNGPGCHFPALKVIKDRLGIRSEGAAHSSNTSSVKENVQTL